MLDHVMRFNESVAAAKMAEMARVALVPGVLAMREQDAAAAFIAWIVQLKAQLGVPAKLAAVGVNTAQIAALVEVAIHDICHQTNPRPCTREDFARIFAAAI